MAINDVLRVASQLSILKPEGKAGSASSVSSRYGDSRYGISRSDGSVGEKISSSVRGSDSAALVKFSDATVVPSSTVERLKRSFVKSADSLVSFSDEVVAEFSSSLNDLKGVLDEASASGKINSATLQQEADAIISNIESVGEKVSAVVSAPPSLESSGSSDDAGDDSADIVSFIEGVASSPPDDIAVLAEARTKVVERLGDMLDAILPFDGLSRRFPPIDFSTKSAVLNNLVVAERIQSDFRSLADSVKAASVELKRESERVDIASENLSSAQPSLKDLDGAIRVVEKTVANIGSLSAGDILHQLKGISSGKLEGLLG